MLFTLRVGVILLTLWSTALACYAADDAAALDSWQNSFHDVWLADSCVQEFQSWKKYWGEVHVFYFGGNGYAGWFADSQKLLTHVTDPAAGTAVSAQLTLLGRRVGGEWAKDDGCRKIRTRSNFIQKISEPGKPALLDWEYQLNKAANADSGNGQSIEAAIKPINSQLDALGIATPSS
jgi:hypothetical protein